jgi:hypothetical protein
MKIFSYIRVLSYFVRRRSAKSFIKSDIWNARLNLILFKLIVIGFITKQLSRAQYACYIYAQVMLYLSSQYKENVDGG